MRTWMWIPVATVLLGTPALSLAEESQGDVPKLHWLASLRVRPEYNDNISDVASSRDDKIYFTSYRANVGFSVELDKNVSLLFDGQALGEWGEDQTPIRGTQTLDATTAKYNFYRAYLEARDIFGQPFSLRAGRQPLVYGDEWLLGDLDFYGGTSWDGVRGDFGGHGKVSLIWAVGGEANRPELVALTPDSSGDFSLYGAWTNWHPAGTSNLDAAVLYWFDHRKISPFGFLDKRFTYTARYSLGSDTGPFLNANAALQRGKTIDVGFTQHVNIDARGWEVTGGWTWKRQDQPNKVWARVAAYSGDQAGTKDNETFNPLTMDFHGRYGFIDFWNGFFGHQAYLGGAPGFEALQLGFDVQIKNGVRIKGIAQRQRRDEPPSAGFKNRNLGQEYGVSASYDYGRNLSLELGIAELFPGTAFTAEPPLLIKGQSTVRRAYLNAVAHF